MGSQLAVEAWRTTLLDNIQCPGVDAQCALRGARGSGEIALADVNETSHVWSPNLPAAPRPNPPCCRSFAFLAGVLGHFRFGSHFSHWGMTGEGRHKRVPSGTFVSN